MVEAQVEAFQALGEVEVVVAAEVAEEELREVGLASGEAAVEEEEQQ